ncbi:MAG TPA: hypothetical protein VNS58_18200 [Puia sp.]|nr:hypothetical protein [Puia sp.]
MNTKEQMEERLWDYIDGLSSPEEKTTISALIAANLEWQRKYTELLDIHQLMDSTELEAPSMRFTKNVMEEISRYQVAPATKTYINKNIIRSIGAFFLLMIGSILIYFFGQMQGGDSGSSPQVTQFSQTLQNNLNKFNWSKIFNSTYMNVFLMINVILALVLVDMYLQRKKQQSSH